MNDDQQNTVLSKASVFGLLDEAPMTALHYCYWLLASGGTLLDVFSVVSLGIAIPLLKQEMTVTPVLVGLIGSALVLGRCSERCWAGSPDRRRNRNRPPASGSYVSEITPRSLRSRMTVATIALQSVGMILAAVVAIAIFRFHPSAPDWRLLLGTGGLLETFSTEVER
jgi:MFS family permease